MTQGAWDLIVELRAENRRLTRRLYLQRKRAELWKRRALKGRLFSKAGPQTRRQP